MSGRDLSERSISSLFKLASHKNAIVVDMWERRERRGRGG